MLFQALTLACRVPRLWARGALCQARSTEVNMIARTGPGNRTQRLFIADEHHPLSPGQKPVRGSYGCWILRPHSASHYCRYGKAEQEGECRTTLGKEESSFLWAWLWPSNILVQMEGNRNGPKVGRLRKSHRHPAYFSHKLRSLLPKEMEKQIYRGY